MNTKYYECLGSDPVTAITALGIAGNVLQFVDFGLTLVFKAREIHESAKGALAEHVDIGLLAKDLTALTEKLEASSTATSKDDSLDKICKRCTATGKELLETLRKMEVDEEKTKIKSARKALKIILGRDGVEEIKERLEDYRKEIEFHVMVDLK
jgi:hypothetical protein